MRLLQIIPVFILALAAAPVTARAQDAAPEPLPSVALPPELDRVLRDYERLWAAGDEAGLADLFAEDGFVLQNGRPAVRGREAIQRAYAEFSGPLRLRAISFAVEERLGYIIGAYTYGDGPEMGKFVLTLRRSPGEPWLIVSDMDNANRMPRMAPRPSRSLGPDPTDNEPARHLARGPGPVCRCARAVSRRACRTGSCRSAPSSPPLRSGCG